MRSGEARPRMNSSKSRGSVRVGKFRSKLEAAVAGYLAKILDHPAKHEGVMLPYTIEAEYKPDFTVFNHDDTPTAIYLEVKGYFPPEDRRKMLAVKAAHPQAVIVMVFSRANVKINSGSKTTYAMWCDKHGIRWCTTETLKETLRSLGVLA